ncbi:MAG: four helix bundle protein [Verrucomicrobiota bacterium]
MRSERPHRRLKAWQKGMDLYVDIFQLTKILPKEELFGLSSQMRRAAQSVASNIAEGAAKDSQKDFARFLNTAEGSLSELDTQLEGGLRVGYFTQEAINPLYDLIDETSALVAGLKRKLKSEG